ncbi:hypothetical protein BC567DRAFT_296555 [Phyllosticta citribraziliensis]
MAGLHPPTVLPPWTPELHASYVSQARTVVDAYLAPGSRPKQFRDREQVNTFFREVLGPSNFPVSDSFDKPKEQIIADVLASVIPNLFAAGYWCWESEAGYVPVMNAPQAAPVQRATSQTHLVARPEHEAQSTARAYESPSGSSISGGLTWQDSKDLRAEEISLGNVQFQPVLDDPERLLNLKVTLTMLHQDRRDHEHCHQQIEQLKAENRALQLRIRDLEQPSYAPNSGERIDRQPSLISTTEDLINKSTYSVLATGGGPPIKSEPGLTEATESADKLYNRGGLRSTPRDEGDDAGEKKRRRFRYDLDQAQHDNDANEVKAKNAPDVFSAYNGSSLDEYSNDIVIPLESFGDVCTLIDGCKFIKAFGFIELRWAAPDNSCSSLKLRFPSKEVNINALYTPNNVNPHKRRDLNICLRKGKNVYESPWYWVPINWAKTLMRVDYFGPFLDKRSHVIIDTMAKIAEMCDDDGQPLDQPQSSPC